MCNWNLNLYMSSYLKLLSPVFLEVCKLSANNLWPIFIFQPEAEKHTILGTQKLHQPHISTWLCR